MVEELRNIDKVISARQYPFFRLLDSNGIQIVPPKRHKKNTEGYIQHWQFIKHRLVHELPVGTYIFQAFYDTAKTTKSDYIIEKKENEEIIPVIISEGKTENNKTMHYDKDLIELIKENEKLKAEKSVLMIELQLAKEKYSELENELSDMENLSDGVTGGIQGGITALAPLIPILEKFMEQSDKRLRIEEIKLQKATAKNFKPLIKKQATMSNENLTPQRENESEYNSLLSYFDNLLNENEEQANNELDIIQNDNPNLYANIVRDLKLEENGD